MRQVDGTYLPEIVPLVPQVADEELKLRQCQLMEPPVGTAPAEIALAPSRGFRLKVPPVADAV